MTKSIIVSDVHYGSYKEFNDGDRRLKRCEDALRYVLEYARANDINTIIDAGDLIDRKDKIEVQVYNSLFGLLQQYEQDFSFHLLVGNHNVAVRDHREANNLEPLTMLNRAHVYSQPCLRKMLGVAFAFIPYMWSIDDWWDAHNDLAEQVKSAEYERALLIAHQEIDGAVTGTHRYQSRGGVDPNKISDVFQWSLFGHYHLQQRLTSRCMYVGALLQQEFGEEGNPQVFLVLDHDTMQLSAHTVPASEFRTVSDVNQLNPSSGDFYRLRTEQEYDEVLDSVDPIVMKTVRVERKVPVASLGTDQVASAEHAELIQQYLKLNVPSHLHGRVLRILEQEI